jgi:hypothetical protein
MKSGRGWRYPEGLCTSLDLGNRPPRKSSHLFLPVLLIMWRSWVDRLNTASADAEETERHLYDAEKHLTQTELQQ